MVCYLALVFGPILSFGVPKEHIHRLSLTNIRSNIAIRNPGWKFD